MDTTIIKGASYENVQNNAKINEGYEVPMENEYAEIEAQAKNTEYEYIKEQNIPIQAMHRNTSTEPPTNQPYETLQHKKTSQPSWFKRHRIMFAVILSVVLTALISAVVFLTVLVVMKSDGDNCKYNDKKTKTMTFHRE